MEFVCEMVTIWGHCSLRRMTLAFHDKRNRHVMFRFHFGSPQNEGFADLYYLASYLLMAGPMPHVGPSHRRHRSPKCRMSRQRKLLLRFPETKWARCLLADLSAPVSLGDQSWEGDWSSKGKRSWERIRSWERGTRTSERGTRTVPWNGLSGRCDNGGSADFLGHCGDWRAQLQTRQATRVRIISR